MSNLETSIDKPIWFSMNVGSLGHISFYVKSREMIEDEQREDDDEIGDKKDYEEENVM